MLRNFYPPPHSLIRVIERETDGEFDPDLWFSDPELDLDARAWRDEELLLDLTGNLDSCV